ncbi:GNAT family N-acetyltransferase [Aureimonas psammosilenae]|uniref:GNAT family N-acetyltransferase n=1 Tax=Aureimonas psammosilenae TaxID=2495496 RepID=UPI00126078F9|nr:GNAT family N-acetyltransferase [Aureimonas psammosilenae]
MEAAPIRDQHGDIALVPFAERHLEGAHRLSRALVWPFRREDWAFALTVGRGFVLERAGAVIGTAIWFPNGESHASVGMIIVDGAEQGRGYGARLFDELLDAAKGRSILLNATPEGRGLYERRGFRAIGMIEQRQGVLPGRHEAPPENVVRPMRPDEFDALARLDRAASGRERTAMLQRLVAAGETFVLLRNGEPAGYAISRLFGRGHVVGPVAAESPAAARLLIEAALSRLEGRFVRIDPPVDAGLGSWLDEIGLPQMSDALTMVLGTVEPTGPARLFAPSNQSFL